MSEEDENSVKIDVDDESEKEEESNDENQDADDTDSVDDKSKTVPPSATSRKSNLSRKGSGKSQKSVVWSTGASSEKELLDDNESKKGKAGSILGVISGMWNSREMMKDNADQQLFVKVTLRELIIYCGFMFIICYVTLMPYSPRNFLYKGAVESLFGSQMDVTNMRQFWEFVEGDMLDNLYWEEFYNKGYKTAPGLKIQPLNCPFSENMAATKPCPVEPADRNVMYENRMLGLPRLRMIAMKNDSCQVESAFQGAIRQCYAQYSRNKTYGVENGTFFPRGRAGKEFRKYSSEWAWRYRTAEELGGGASSSGKVDTYDGDGYTQTLHYLKNDSAAILAELKRGKWVTQGTRFVSIDFTFYNANINLFCIVKLMFEFPATGGVIPSSTYNMVKLIKYRDNFDYVYMACEYIFYAFIVYYIIEECVEIYCHGMAHFKAFWNWLDMVILGVALGQVVLGILTELEVHDKIAILLSKPFEYADFSQLANRNQLITELSAFNLFVAWLKVYKYMSFNKTMATLTGTIAASGGDLVGFIVIFMIIFMAYSQLGYLMFGVQIGDYSTLITSCYTLFRTILGDFNFTAMEKANPFTGVVFFISYIFFVFFVLLNMFLAIINDTYAEVKEDVTNKPAEFSMGDFFSTGVNNVKGSMGIVDRGVDVENAIKLAAADDGFVTYDEIRENLRKARFSDIEIDLFFAMFQNDPFISQMILDEDEVKAKQLEEEKRKMSALRGDSEEGDNSEEYVRPKSGKSARSMRNARRLSSLKAGGSVLDKDYYDLSHRIDSMQTAIIPLSVNLDKVLEKLNGTGKDRKIRRKDMENIFDDIVKGEAGWMEKLNSLEK